MAEAKGNLGPTKHQAKARYRKIVRFALRVMLIEWWFGFVLPRFGLIRISRRGRAERFRKIAKRFHALAVDLGGLMIKVGQFMSARMDVLPPEITEELDGLQDEVPPAPFDGIRVVAEAELGRSLESAFASFDPVPVAAASLGQAHRAELTEAIAEDTGFKDVIVKVQRPGIDTIVDVDLAALRKIGAWLSRIKAVSARVNVPALVEEFAVTSMQEIDYLQEASNAEHFAEDFQDDPRVNAPQVAWERTTVRVLTLEDVTAIKITDVQSLQDAGIDPAQVANELATVTLDQLFVHGFFHGDPHPGNIFVTPGQEGEEPTWSITYVDFGMMGEIPDTLREGLRELFVAVVARDSKGMVDSIQKVGVLLPSANTDELERMLHELFDRFGGMGVQELSKVSHAELGQFAEQFGETIRSMPVQLPENFLLIIRAVSLLSGVCSALYPEFNIWEAVEPYANDLVRSEGGRTIQHFGKQITSTFGMIAGLPKRIDKLATAAETGSLQVKTPGVDRELRRVERLLKRVISAVVFMALLISGTLLRTQYPGFGNTFMLISVLPLFHALFSGIFTGGPHGRR
jgi:Predicted unusual protein kinase